MLVILVPLESPFNFMLFSKIIVVNGTNKFQFFLPDIATVEAKPPISQTLSTPLLILCWYNSQMINITPKLSLTPFLPPLDFCDVLCYVMLCHVMSYIACITKQVYTCSVCVIVQLYKQVHPKPTLEKECMCWWGLVLAEMCPVEIFPVHLLPFRLLQFRLL